MRNKASNQATGIGHQFRALRFLLEKEFLQIRRDKTILRMIFALPIIQLLVLPWAATFEQHNISLGVIDNDRTEMSARMAHKITSSGFFRLVDFTDSYENALHKVEKNEADLILEIPAGFERDLMREQSTSLMLSVNAVNGQKAGLGGAYMGQILADYNQEIITDLGVQLSRVNLIEAQPYFKYNKEMNYRNFMVPGILVMLMTLIGGVISALNIVKEKEIGTMEQINVTPVSRGIFILGKLIPFLIIGLLIFTIGLLLAWGVYGIFPAGSIAALYIFAFFYLLAFLGAGLVISTYSDTQQQAMFVAIFFMVIFFLLGGLFTPISSMPEWAQRLTLLNPVRYFVEVMRLVYMKGSNLGDILPQLLSIIGFAAAFNFWAVRSYRKTS